MDYFYTKNPFFSLKKGLSKLTNHVITLLMLVFALGNVFAQNTWTARTAPNLGYNSVAYGNGTFVVVQNGTTPATSPDGITWTARTCPSSYWTAVTFGNGLFVAVSYTGFGVMTSPDGITWTTRTSPASPLWESVTFGNGLFVAVAPNRVMTSADGITWTLRTPAQGNNWYGVTYGNGVFVAVSTNGTNRVMTSANGITWVSRTAAAANSWQKITFGNGLFVAVSSDGTNRVMTSVDGITWASRSASVNNGWRAVVYGDCQFVALAGDGVGNRAMSSPDGVTWTTRASTSDIDWKGLGYANGRFVAVAYSNVGIMTSDLVAPEINIQGNGTSIMKGNNGISVTDHTSFGSVNTGSNLVRTYTIQNTGVATLNITSIVSSGANASKFVVGTAPTSINAGSSATFTVTYTPTVVMTDNATITINNNDCNEASYDFAVQGTVINPAISTVRGNMASFDGVNDFITSASNVGISGNSSRTIETWFKVNSVAGIQVVTAIGGTVANATFGFYVNGGALVFFAYGSNDYPVGTTIDANTWYHVAVTYDGTTIRPYVNGILQTTRNAALNTSNDVLRMGRNVTIALEYCLNGNLDEVRVWNTARTQAQIRENMHLTLSGAESGLVAYYQFNEASGVAIDAISGNNGALQNGATRVVSEVAVAQGISHRMTPTTGLNTFTNADVSINLSTAPADEMVAYKLNGSPVNGVSQSNMGVSTVASHWIVRQFGTGSIAYNGMNFTLPMSSTISAADEATPSNLKLYTRPNNAINNFPAFFASATNANNTTKVIQFTGFTSQTSVGQFEIGSMIAPNAFFVSPTGNDANDGLTAGTPKLTIANALALAGEGETVNIAMGNYSEILTINKNVTFATTGAVFVGNITMSGAGKTLTLSNELQVGSVSLPAGTIASNGNLTLVSNAMGTGLIDDFTTGFTGNITGNINVQRYVANANAGYRYFGSPVTGANSAQFGFNTFAYNESILTTNMNLGWQFYAGILTPFAGYNVFQTIGGNQTYTLTGTANTGTYNTTITRQTPNGTANGSAGFNALGNPYPSPISWTGLLGLNAGQITGTAWIFKTTGLNTGQWASINSSGVSTTGATNMIASSQGFLVRKATAGSSTFTINNSVRNNVLTNNSNYLRGFSHSLVRLQLGNGEIADETVLYAEEQATEKIDIGLDTEKITGETDKPYLAFSNNDQDLSILALNTLQEGTQIPLKVRVNGIFTFSLTEKTSLTSPIYLLDKKLNTSHNLQKPYTFNGVGVENNRFVLVIGNVETETTQNNNEIKVWANAQTLFVNFEDTKTAKTANLFITDLQGKTIFTQNTLTQKNTLNINAPKGIYVVKVQAENGVTTKKVIFE